MLKAEYPFSFILFGASGHLAKIKIFPALYYLALKKRLPERYSIVGYARTEMTNEVFRSDVALSVAKEVPEVNERVLSELLTHVHYQTGQYDQAADFKALARRLTELEKGMTKPVRLAYFSIPPSAFSSVLENLSVSGVHDHSRRYADFRCIVEKPIGSDVGSFTRIRGLLLENLKPEETYLLDHYLGKEAVRNVTYLRYANPVIERLLKNTLISSVQITATETAGLEGRAGYFDAVGTLRDMVQSHLLQITSLLTMRLLGDGAALKAARLDALSKLYLPPSPDLGHVVMQGQYDRGTVGSTEAPAYVDEQNIPVDSRTPTFVAVKLMSRSSRWEGVPIFLHSGKRLHLKETRIAIEFQESLMLDHKETPCNRLDIILQGEAGMKLYLRTKIGGSEPKFRPLVMEDPLMCVGDCLVEHSLLLLEAINGNQQWFLDPEEVRVAWNLIDPLQKYLDDPSTPLALYPAGSKGPKEADEFIARSGCAWLN